MLSFEKQPSGFQEEGLRYAQGDGLSARERPIVAESTLKPERILFFLSFDGSTNTTCATLPSATIYAHSLNSSSTPCDSTGHARTRSGISRFRLMRMPVARTPSPRLRKKFYFIRAAKWPDLYDAGRVILNQGMRPEEVTSLARFDIDLERG
jgi:hypothetical protein